LLSNFFQVENIAFVNQFYKQTLIKKRIIMMKKNQSKKMNQLKYLILIPVLASMLFYTSCAESTTSEVLVKKQIETRYRLKDGKLVGKEGCKETYLDSYVGLESPLNAIEISIDDLSKEEMQEFVEIDAKYKERLDEKSKFSKFCSFKFYKMPNGRNASAMIFNIDKYRGKVKTTKDNTTTETEDVSFMVIDKSPTFPGCESGDKDCFSKMVQKHFSKNFNTDLPNTLGLKSGKKRVFIAFDIDKKGNVVDVKARAPHIDIKDEVIRVMNTLPKMIPGEDNGKKVVVKYSIPVTIVID